MNSSLPVASLESIYGRRQYKAFLEQYAVDVAIVDVPWNDDLVTHPPKRRYARIRRSRHADEHPATRRIPLLDADLMHVKASRRRLPKTPR